MLLGIPRVVANLTGACSLEQGAGLWRHEVPENGAIELL
jgi:hypothetical protein